MPPKKITDSVADDGDSTPALVWGTSSFQPGPEVGLVSRHTIGLIEHDNPSTRERLWRLVADDAPLDDVLDELSSTGLKALPDFGLAQVEGDRVRVVARGRTSITAELADGSEHRIDPSDVRTWIEEVVADVVAITIAMPVDDDANVESTDDFAVLAGSVPARSITRRYDIADPLAGEAIDGWTTGAQTDDGDEPVADEPVAVDAPADEAWFDHGHEPSSDVIPPQPMADGEPASPQPSEPQPASPQPSEPQPSEPFEMVQAADPQPAPPASPQPPPPNVGDPSGAMPAANPSFAGTDDAAGIFDGVDDLDDLPGSDAGGADAMEGDAHDDHVHDDHVHDDDEHDSHDVDVPFAGAAPEATVIVGSGGFPGSDPFANQSDDGPEVEAAITLGVLAFSNGERIEIDRSVLIGRNPKVGGAVSGPLPHLMKFEGPGQGLSRTHAEVRIENGTIVLEDLQSTNGTEVQLPGQQRRRLRGGEPVEIVPGTLIDFGDELHCTVETAR